MHDPNRRRTEGLKEAHSSAVKPKDAPKKKEEKKDKKDEGK
jgi:hypothetical protein